MRYVAFTGSCARPLVWCWTSLSLKVCRSGFTYSLGRLSTLKNDIGGEDKHTA